ncbi:damage-control phosphatase ARMT1 family protein [Actinomycetes bacterium KLBMP 9759]
MRHLIPDPSSVVASTTPQRPDRPPMLDSADPSSFAWTVIHQRHPALIEQVLAAHPYGPAQVAALRRLAGEELVRPLDAATFDAAAWQVWGAGQFGRRWDEVPFLWAESYFYRRLLDAVGFFEPGPLFWLDPFSDRKAAELADPGLVTELAALDDLPDLPAQARAEAALTASLWGNRADLGFALHAAAGTERVAELVVDHSVAFWELVGRAARIAIVADNAGRELLADLVLVDELLTSGRAAQVVIHVKPTPYFVSDATAADVSDCLRRMAAADGNAARIAGRLVAAFRSGQVGLRAHWFWVAPLELAQMPSDLAAQFTPPTVTILKGDLNYRRLVGDRPWPPTTAPAVAADGFRARWAALRTLKSEVVVGVGDDALRRLDEQPGWRTSGSYAMVQVSALTPAG